MSDPIVSPPPGTAAPQPPPLSPHPDLNRPPTGAPGGPPIPPPPPTIALSVDEFQRLRQLEAQYQTLTAEKQAAFDASEAERIKIMAEKGQVEEALKQTNKNWETKHAEAVARHKTLEDQIFSERKNA